jgi:hypothetical protein
MQLGEQLQNGAAIARGPWPVEVSGSPVQKWEDAEGIPRAEPADGLAAGSPQRRHHEIQVPLITQGRGGVHGPAQVPQGGV